MREHEHGDGPGHDHGDGPGHDHGPEHDREARREERRADREARREERRRVRVEMRAGIGAALGQQIHQQIREGIRRSSRRWLFGFGDLATGMPGDTAEASEVVEQRFVVAGSPHLRVNNVSGETEITVGVANEVAVRARKRVRGWSEDRARRLLENIEVRMEQQGDQILIEPRLFEQERGWLDLFRGGRVAVDLDIRVPRETRIEASTVSGELSVTGTRGPMELRSVSGEVSIDDVQGPMRVRTVSGDLHAVGYAGRLEANSVSGEIEIERSRVRSPDVVTVSGDVAIEGLVVAPGNGEGRVKAVSGDVELVPADADLEIDFQSVSGDASIEVPARVEKEGRRDRRIVIGQGGAHFRVKTVSGDLRVRKGSPAAAEVEASAGAEDTVPMDVPTPGAAQDASREVARGILERLARGELSVDDAAVELDATKQA